MAAGVPSTEEPFVAPVLLVRPNPTRGETRVSFDLQASVPVRIDLLDVAGRRIECLLDGTLPGGRHNTTWNATGSGIRFLRLTTTTGRHTTKLIVLK